MCEGERARFGRCPTDRYIGVSSQPEPSAGCGLSNVRVRVKDTLPEKSNLNLPHRLTRGTYCVRPSFRSYHRGSKLLIKADEKTRGLGL